MVDDNKDGGPAFPCDGVKYQTAYLDGMSLLDYFAGQALAGILSGDSYKKQMVKELNPKASDEEIRKYERDPMRDMDGAEVAAYAYWLAEQMLAEKRRREKN